VYVQGPREQVRSCSSKKAVVLHQFRDDSWEDLWLKTQTRLSWGEGGGWSQQQKVDLRGGVLCACGHVHARFAFGAESKAFESGVHRTHMAREGKEEEGNQEVLINARVRWC
jgi:hypothetical protein